MAVKQSSALALWIDLVPEMESAFNEWYRTEHLAERVHVPGFIRGRRFVTVAPASPKYFTLYETENPEVLRSERYVAMLNNPTVGSLTMLPQVRNGFRTAYVVAEQAGSADGEGIATIRFDGAPADAARVRAALPALLAILGVRSAALCEAEPAATGIMTTERRIGGASTPTTANLLLVEVATGSVFASEDYRREFGAEGALVATLPAPIIGEYALVQEYVRPADLPR